MYYQDNEKQEAPSNLWFIWQIYKRNGFDLFGLYLFIMIMLLIFVLPFIINANPFTQNVNARLLPPSWIEGGELIHFFGTDEFGRDFLSRLLIGGQNTIIHSFLATLIAMVIGCVVGITSAITKRKAKKSVMHHFFDILSSIPSILLALIIIAILSPSLSHAMLAIALSQIPRFVHTTYFAVGHELSKEYMTTQILDGAPYFMLIRTTILPNVLDIIIKNFYQALTISVLDISALGFLGFGAPAPIPEWGNMLAQGMDLIFIGSYMAILPGISIMLFIISVNLVGHGLYRVLTEGVKHGTNRY